MAKLKIITGEDNPILRAVSEPVKKFDDELKKLVKDMKETMIKVSGLGLAAPQVGVNLRVFVLFLDYKKKDEKVIAMINPEILEHSLDTEIAEEGCLSVPKFFADVERFRSVKVMFFDVEGIRQALDLSGLDAREVQHEYDHLDGVLFVDRVREQTKGQNEKEGAGEVM